MPSSSHKTLVIVVLAVLIVVAGGLFLYGNRAEAPTETPNGAEVVNQQGTTTPDTTPVNTTPTENPTGTPTAVTPSPKPTPNPVAAPKPKPSVPVPTYGAVINYTNTGFDPRRVTIYKGQTVRFMNKSDLPMWIASDIHPKHSAYLIKTPNDCGGSSFDQCEYVSKGEYWDFKFDAIGSWDFHNEDKPTEGGTVYVIERE